MDSIAMVRLAGDHFQEALTFVFPISSTLKVLLLAQQKPLEAKRCVVDA